MPENPILRDIAKSASQNNNLGVNPIIADIQNGALRANPISENRQIEDVLKNKNIGDVNDVDVEIDSLENANDDEKRWLKESRVLVGRKDEEGKEMMTEDQWQNAKQVLNKEHPDFQGALGSRTAYYWDKSGLPVPLKEGERPPIDSKVESAWGNAYSSSDDAWYTLGAKAFYNTALDVAKIVPNLISFTSGLTTGTDDTKAKSVANEMENAIDRLKFDKIEPGGIIKTEDISDFSDIFKSENWNVNAQTSANMVGSLLGYVAQYMMAGKATGVKQAATKGSQIRRAIGASVAISMEEAINQAEEAGLAGRDKYAVATISAIGTGLLELGLGGVEFRMLGGGAKKQFAAAVANEAATEFIRSGKKITAESLEGAFKASLKKGATVMPAFAKEGLKEGLEEFTQSYYQEAVQSIYDRSIENKFDANIGSAKTFAESLEGFIGGALLGGFGSVKNPNAQNAQAKNIYQAIKQGKIESLYEQFHNLRVAGKITDIEEISAKKKVAAYAEAFEKVDQLPVDEDAKARALQIVYEDKNLRREIEEKKNSLSMYDVLSHAEVKAMEKQSNENLNELTSIYNGTWKQEGEEAAKEVKKEKGPEVAKGEGAIQSPLQATEQVKAVEPNKVPESKPIKAPEVTKKFSEFAENRSGKRGFNTLDQGDRSGVLVDYLKETKKKGIDTITGVVEQGTHAFKRWKNRKGEDVEKRIYYEVDLGGKRIRLASDQFTRFIKERNLVGTNVDVGLIEAEDADLKQLKSTGRIQDDATIIENENGEKVFKFKASDVEYPVILQVRESENNEFLGNLAVRGGKAYRAEGEQKKLETKPDVTKPEFKVRVHGTNYVVERGKKVSAEGEDAGVGRLVVKDSEGNIVTGAERTSVVRKYAKNYDFDAGERLENIPEMRSPEALYDYISQNSKSPLEVIEAYQVAKRDSVGGMADYKEEVINDYLDKVKRSSFVRFDDANNITGQIQRSYFSDAGVGLDEIAQEASEASGIEVTEEDIAEFIKKYPSKKGKNSYEAATKERQPEYIDKLKGRFYNLTGFDLTEKVVDQAVSKALKGQEIDIEPFLTKEYYDEGELIRDYETEYEEAASFKELEEDADIDSGEEQKQKSSKAKSQTKSDRARKIDLLSKALPFIKVVEDGSIEGAGQLDADGKTVRLNPDYNYSDTEIHEFGHAFIDMIGGVGNKFIKQGIDQLRGTKLWDRIVKEYPELDANMLEKEVLATAIGEEGAKLFVAKTKRSAFRNWTDAFLGKIKRLLGLEKNVAKNIAGQLLAGKAIKGRAKATGKVQEKKKREKPSANRIKPMKFSKFADTIGIDTEYMGDRIEEIDEEITEAAGENVEDLIAEKEEIKNNLLRAEELYKNYLSDRADVVELINEMGDVSDMKLDELIETVGKLSEFEDIKRSAEYEDIMFNIGQRLNDFQLEKLKKNKSFDPSKTNIGDLKQTDVFMAGLSTISERFPAVQKLYKEYQAAYNDMASEYETVKKGAKALAKDVISEYHRKSGIAERIKNFVVGGGRKYFSYMAKEGQLLTKEDAEYNQLSPAQRALLDYVNDNVAKTAKYSGANGDVVLKSGAGFIESINKSGLFGSYANWLNNSFNLREVKVLFKDPRTGDESHQYLGDIEDYLNEYAKEGTGKRIQALGLITKYNLKAKNLLATKQNSDGTEISMRAGGGKFYIDKGGRLVSKTAGVDTKGDFSEDYYASFLQYLGDTMFSKYMSPIVPLFNGVDAFYKSLGGKENVRKFLDVAKRGKLIGEVKESGLGAGPDAFLRILRKWTSWRYIAFNVPISLWNIFIGKYNAFRSDGAKDFLRGEKRFFSGAGKNNKAINIINKHLSFLFSDTHDVNPEQNLGHYFSMFSFGGLRYGEQYIRGASLIGKMSDEHYEWMDKDGEVQGKDSQERAEREKIIKEELLQYSAEVDQIQGRYGEVEKRNFGYMALGQSFGQFKVWMPEWLSERFAKRYIDANGVERIGSFRELSLRGTADLAKDVLSRKFYTSDELEYVKARKNLRGAMSMAGMMLIYLSASDDKEDKEMASTLDKALSNMAGIFDMGSVTFTLSQPMASMAVVIDFVKALGSSLDLATYKTKTKSHDAGDLKAPGMFFKLIPGSAIERQIEGLFTTN